MSSVVVPVGNSTGDHDYSNQETSQHEDFSPSRQPSKKYYKLRRYDSLEVESVKFRGHQTGHGSKGASWAVTLQLAFQSIGVVYGDIGTSPLYVYSSTFSNGVKENDDVLGVYSLIFYTITLIPLIKYVFVLLRANDNGDGGTFALYSLICRHAKVGMIPSQQYEDADVSNFKLELASRRLQRASRIKAKLEESQFAKLFLLFAAMLGTSMVISDGVLTPCISVLSAVEGITEGRTDDKTVWISVAILICLFLAQRFGTDKVGYTFAPIMCIWFLLNAGIGLYNFIKFDPTVLKALNPKYIVDYFQRNKKDAWVSLGGVVLAITGTEAIFADVGHFTLRSIQISACTVIIPALICTYTGQASFLIKNKDLYDGVFYNSIPDRLYWPMLVLALLVSMIASQDLISGTFSIIQQSLSFGCFPQVKIVHTSTKYGGEVYIPEVNYLLMLACVGVTLGFRSTTNIGNAYGITDVFVMTLNSALLVLIMLMIWKTNLVYIILFVVAIGIPELVYLSSVINKFDQGGYLPLAFAAVLMLIMYVWNDVYRKKYYYELANKISPDKVKEIVASTNNYNRLPGLAIFYSELVHGIPPIFKHYVENVPAVHSVLVFASIKSLPISKVLPEERFIFRRVQPNNLHVFRCVARYGYTDVRNENEPFELMLIEKLKDFIKEDSWLSRVPASSKDEEDETEMDEKGEIIGGEHINEKRANNGNGRQDVDDQEVMGTDIEVVNEASRAAVVHLIGQNEVIARKGSGVGKRVLIDYAYNFLKKNLRQTDEVFEIPHKRMLKVGMTYEL